MKYFFLIIFLSCSCLVAKNIDPKDVLDLYKKNKLETNEEESLTQYSNKVYKNHDLTKGLHRPIIKKLENEGGITAWFMKATPGSNVFIHAEKKRSWKMREIGNSGLFFCAEEFPPMSSVHFRYTVNNYRYPMKSAHRFGFENYTLGEMSLKQNGVPVGKLVDMGVYESGDKYYKNSKRNWWVYVPQQYKKSKEAKLMVFNDGDRYIKGDGNACLVLDNLIHHKKVPVTIAVFINPGKVHYADSKKPPYSNRSNKYDTCTPKFADFFEEEILSQLYAKYSISKNAEDHVICGASSGGSGAFTAAWFRNDLFNRVISFIGSYCDFRSINDFPFSKGYKSEYGPYKVAHDYPSMIRKMVPPKKIRVYLQDGENDLDNVLGNWFLNNLRMENALAFAGYPYKAVWGKGMHSRKHSIALYPEAFEWIWKDDNWPAKK